MDSWTALPDTPLDADGDVSRACRRQGLTTLRGLAQWLASLPYGRAPGGERADWADVLRAGRGTCSTKHALLAAAAAENGTPLALCLGLYEMNERNTPGVGAALHAAQLECVPEAHCYVRWRGIPVDITRDRPAPGASLHVLLEETITPDQTGAYKLAWHREQLRRWCEARGLEDPEAVWAAREACIEALRETPA